MSENLYHLSEALRDYGLEELAFGAKWYLSTKPDVTLYNRYEYPAFHAVLGNAMRTKMDSIQNENLLLYQTWSKEPSAYSSVQTEVCIDPNHGELVRSWCSCGGYERRKFACKHITGLITHHFLQCGEQLEGTILEDTLKEMTGCEEPLAPGSLRPTSPAIKALIGKNEGKQPVKQVPAWVLGEKKGSALALSAEVAGYRYNNQLAVELKAGPRKLYQIKDIHEFLDAYEKKGSYAFSSSQTCRIGAEYFPEETAKILTFLQEQELIDRMKRQQEENNNSYSYRAGVMSQAQRTRILLLQGRDLDDFMALMDGKLFTVTQNDSSASGKQKAVCTVNLSGQPAPVTLEKTRFGAIMRMEKEYLIGCGKDFLYLIQNDQILPLPARNWEMHLALENAFRNETELYVEESDIPSLCQQLQPETRGFSMEQYQEEKPRIQILLDYPQEGMITCKALAVYSWKESGYSLFVQEEEKEKRNLQAEQNIGEEIWEFFDAWDQENGQLVLECGEERLYEFLTVQIPILAGYGEVLISDRMKRLKVKNAGELNVGIQVDAGNLLMSLHSNEMSKEEIIEVLSSYSRKKHFTRLKNGTFISHDPENAAVWEALSETFRAYGKKNPEAMKLPMFRALYIEEMLRDRDNIALEEGSDYKKLLSHLKNEEAWDYPIPENLDAVLRPYQKDGYRWLTMLKENGFGGILADDMGLGKTLQVLAFLLGDKKRSEAASESKKHLSLIVSPASLVYNWQKEIRTFVPEMSCTLITGSMKERRALLGELKNNEAEKPDIIVTSYDLLKRDVGMYEGIHFDHQIIDEAQYIKNQNTQAAKAVRVIDSSFRIALTGTPIENRLSELWSIFDYIMPGFLYGYGRFRQDYESPVIADQDQEVLDRLRRMIHPFILRRLKKEVLKDLPDKLEETVSIRMEAEQRKVYDAYAERLRLYLDKQSEEEYHQSKLEILSELTHLRQICCGPELFLDNYKGKNAKMEACIELIGRATSGGHKVLLFSQFVSVLDELGKHLKAEKISYYRIDGSTPKEERMRLVDEFQKEDDTTSVFCISLKAGGTGLNLTAADIVIHFDPWWNIAAQNQATDRTHRIGQTNTVTVYSLIAEDSIEEQIALLQKSKAKLAEDILAGEGIASILIHKEDLLALL